MSGDKKELIVRLPIDLHAALKERAIADERTLSAEIRVAIRHYLTCKPQEDS